MDDVCPDSFSSCGLLCVPADIHVFFEVEHPLVFDECGEILV